ncbi:hypothetical protein M885DRAFT_506738 [Pelagophyceae sp. CCMP2097]|nr:hypothetical protein M885DRAFT_506738 [Pelagophyceae sp. CCMP2097]
MWGRKSTAAVFSPAAAAAIVLEDAWPALEPNEVHIAVLRGRNLRVMDKHVFSAGGSSDPFVQVSVQGGKARTSTVKKTTAPEWHSVLVLPASDLRASVEIACWDEDMLSSPDFMGKFSVPLATLADREAHAGWFALLDADLAAPSEPRGDVEVQIRWVHNPALAAALPDAFWADPADHAGKKPNALRVCVVRASNLPAMDSNVLQGASSDPFVRLALGGDRCRTSIKKKNLNPTWLETLDLRADDVDADEALDVEVLDYDLASAPDLIGSVKVRDIADMLAAEPGGGSQKRRPRHRREWFTLDLPPAVFKSLSKEKRDGGVSVELALRAVFAPQFLQPLPAGALEGKAGRAERQANELRVVVVRAKHLPAMGTQLLGGAGTADPFVVVEFRGARRKTPAVKQNLHPTWMAPLQFGREGALQSETVRITVFHQKTFSSAVFMARCDVALDVVSDSAPFRAWHRLSLLEDGSGASSAKVEIAIRWVYTAALDVKLPRGVLDDRFHQRLPNQLSLVVIRARALPVMDANLFAAGGSTDPFVEVTVDGERHKTSVKRKTLEPIWNEVLEFAVDAQGSTCTIVVMDYDDASAPDVIGRLFLKVDDFAHREVRRQWYTLVDSDGAKVPGAVELAVRRLHNPALVAALPKPLTLPEGAEAPNELRLCVVRGRNLPKKPLVGHFNRADPAVRCTLRGETRETVSHRGIAGAAENTGAAENPLFLEALEAWALNEIEKRGLRLFVEVLDRACSGHVVCSGWLDLEDAGKSVAAAVRPWVTLKDASGNAAGKVELGIRWFDNAQRRLGLPKEASKRNAADPVDAKLPSKLPSNELYVYVLRASRLPVSSPQGAGPAPRSSCSCHLRLDAETRASATVSDDASPEFALQGSFEYPDVAKGVLELTVRDDLSPNGELLGRATVALADLVEKGPFRSWLELLNGPAGLPRGSVEVFLRLAHSKAVHRRTAVAEALKVEAEAVARADLVSALPLQLGEESEAQTAAYAAFDAMNVARRVPNEVHVVLVRARRLVAGPRAQKGAAVPDPSVPDPSVPDPFVNVSVSAMMPPGVADAFGPPKRRVFDSHQSKVISGGDRAPAWRERFTLKLPRAHQTGSLAPLAASTLNLVVYDSGEAKKRAIGSVLLEMEELQRKMVAAGGAVRAWLPLSTGGDVDVWLRLHYNGDRFPEEVLCDEVLSEAVSGEPPNELRCVIVSARAALRFTHLPALTDSKAAWDAARRRGGLCVEIELSGRTRQTLAQKWEPQERSQVTFRERFELLAKRADEGSRAMLLVKVFEFVQGEKFGLGSCAVPLADINNQGRMKTLDLTANGESSSGGNDALEVVATVQVALRLCHNSKLANMLLPEPTKASSGTATGLDAPPLPPRVRAVEKSALKMVCHTSLFEPEPDAALAVIEDGPRRLAGGVEEENDAAPRWFYLDAEVVVGPCSVSQLRQAWDAQRLVNDSLVWREGLQDWRSVDDLHALKRVLWDYPAVPKAAPRGERKGDGFFVAPGTVARGAGATQGGSDVVDVFENPELAAELDVRAPLDELEAGAAVVDGAQGPFTLSEVRDAVECGRLGAGDVLWRRGEGGWAAVGDVAPWKGRQDCEAEALESPGAGTHCELCGGLATVHSVDALDVQLDEGDAEDESPPAREPQISNYGASGSTLYAREILDGAVWIAAVREASEPRKLRALAVTHVACVGGLQPPQGFFDEDDAALHKAAALAAAHAKGAYVEWRDGEKWAASNSAMCAEGDQKFSDYDSALVKSPPRRLVQADLAEVIDGTETFKHLEPAQPDWAVELRKVHIPLFDADSYLSAVSQLSSFLDNATFRASKHVRVLVFDHGDEAEDVADEARPLWRSALLVAAYLARANGLRAAEALRFVARKLTDEDAAMPDEGQDLAVDPSKLVPCGWAELLQFDAERTVRGRLFCGECFEKWRFGAVDDVLSTKVQAALRRLRARDESLVSLELRDEGPLDSDAAGVLGAAAGYASALTSLDLASCRLGDAGAAALATSLANGCVGVGGRLAALGLSYNDIGDAGVRAVAALLAQRPHGKSKDPLVFEDSEPPLTALDVSHNRFSFRGARQLARALRSNEGLVSLDVSWNALGDAGGEAMWAALTRPDAETLMAVRAHAYEVQFKGPTQVEGLSATAAAAKLAELEEQQRDRVLAVEAFNNTLTCLDLSGNALGPRAATAMAAAVRANDVLARVSVASNADLFSAKPREDTSYIGQFVVDPSEARSSKVTELDFQCRTFSARQEALQNLRDSKRRANQLHPREALVNLRLFNRALVSLSLSFVPLDAHCLREIGRWISGAQRKCACRHLELSGCGVDARGAAALADGLAFGDGGAVRNGLESLDLSRNPLASRGAVHLALALALALHAPPPDVPRPPLRTLSLAQCGIDEDGAEALFVLFDGRASTLASVALDVLGPRKADDAGDGGGDRSAHARFNAAALKRRRAQAAAGGSEGALDEPRRPTGLTSLDLSDNAVGPRGAEALARAAALAVLDEAPVALRVLRLANAGLGPRGAEVLGRLLERGGLPRLDTLDVSTNAMQDSGCAALARALRAMPRLRRVDVGFNDLSEHAAAALQLALVTASTSSDADKLLPLDVVTTGNFDDLDGTKLHFAIAPNLARAKVNFTYQPTLSPREFPAPRHVEEKTRARRAARERRALEAARPPRPEIDTEARADEPAVGDEPPHPPHPSSPSTPTVGRDDHDRHAATPGSSELDRRASSS